MSAVKTTTVLSLEDVIDQALTHAKTLGATQAEASVGRDSGFSVTVRQGEVETLEYHKDNALSITVYFGHRTGSASSSDISSEAIQDTVQAACDIARFTGEDPYVGLADPSELATTLPNLDLYHPWNITPEAAILLAQECEEQGRLHDKRIVNSEGTTVSTHEHQGLYGNSLLFRGKHCTTQHSLGCGLVAKVNDDMQRDHEFTLSRVPQHLLSPKEIGIAAAKRAVQRLGARQIPTCQVPVLFAPDMARGLISSFVGAIQGSSLYRKTSFLMNTLECPVFASHVQLEEKPHLPQRLGSRAFDADGVATKERCIVSQGILRSYLLDVYSARKLGLQTTGHASGIHNLFIHTSTSTQADLIKTMGCGLLVTELLGHGINMVTGDYSRGAAGFWIENGEIQFPVAEITIAGNLKTMFLNLVAIANDVDHRSTILTGSILIDCMTVGGLS